MRFLKWLLSRFAKRRGHYRVQIFTECIRIHPKDEDRKIKDIQQTSLKIFAMAHQTQEELKSVQKYTQ
jgi:hypothetical protein